MEGDIIGNRGACQVLCSVKSVAPGERRERKQKAESREQERLVGRDLTPRRFSLLSAVCFLLSPPYTTTLVLRVAAALQTPRMRTMIPKITLFHIRGVFVLA